MREIVVFSLVGILATLTHYFSAIFVIELFGWHVMLANVVAYCIAVGVSFFGHSVFTFKAAMTRHRLVRFVVVSLTALLLTQLLLLGLTKIAWSGYRINMLAVVCVVPIYSYVVSKLWVYKKSII